MQEPDDILKANRLIFPGVGAFATAMNVLNERGLVVPKLLFLNGFCFVSYFTATLVDSFIMYGY